MDTPSIAPRQTLELRIVAHNIIKMHINTDIKHAAKRTESNAGASTLEDEAMELPF